MKHLTLEPQDDFHILAGTTRSQAATMILAPGESTGGPDNRHDRSDQWLYVISGQGEAIVNGQTVALSPESLLLIEAGEGHEIRNPGDQPLNMLTFYCPPVY